MKITENITIEDLIETIPNSVKYLSEKGIQCVVCGEPVWGTLEEVSKAKGFDDEQIKQFVSELQEIA